MTFLITMLLMIKVTMVTMATMIFCNNLLWCAAAAVVVSLYVQLGFYQHRHDADDHTPDDQIDSGDDHDPGENDIEDVYLLK